MRAAHYIFLVASVLPAVAHAQLRGRAVTWTADGGSITAHGLYVAPEVAGVYHVTATIEGLSDTATILVVGRQARSVPWKEIAALCAVVRCDRIARGALAEFRWHNRRLAGFRVSPPMLISLALILALLAFVGLRRDALRLCAA